MSTKYNLKGKVVLITGAAGGIGAATARKLHERGALLVLTDTSQHTVDALAAEFDPASVLPLALDVTDSTATHEVVRRTVVRFGRLDVAFANAGITWRDAPATMATCDEHEFERIIEVDLLGVWRTTRAALPQILRSNGQILMTSSIYSFVNGMLNAPYAASKAAVEMLGRSLRAELAGTGATASVLYPGWTATPMAKMALGGNALATRLVETAYPAFLRRPIQPEEIARVVVEGLTTRKARIMAPARWVPLSLVRGAFNVVADAYLEHHPRLRPLVRELEGTERRTAATSADLRPNQQTFVR